MSVPGVGEEQAETLSWLRGEEHLPLHPRIQQLSLGARLSGNSPCTGTENSSQRHFLTWKSWQTYEEYGHVIPGTEAGKPSTDD